MLRSRKWWPSARRQGFSWFVPFTVTLTSATHIQDPQATLNHVLLDSVFILSFTNDKWPCQCQLEASKRKTVVGIAATAKLWIDDQYRPVLPFYILLVTIHVLLDSFSFVTSRMTNNVHRVNWEQPRGRQRWASQELSNCELTTWCMINIDLLYHLTYCW
jgi:hypothetical protein